MKLRDPRLWIAVCSIGAVVGMSLSHLGQKAPGPLTAVHARSPDLTGFGSCANCHGGWTSDMTTSCQECHAPIAEQIATGGGLHGTLGARATACAMCHSEHHGPDFRMVNRQSFALAGVPDPLAFDHRLVGYEMGGRHLELGCADCHQHADVDVLPEGATRFLGLPTDCADCHTTEHREAHGGAFVRDCRACHGETGFETPVPVDHDRWLSLDGGHAGVACADCHTPGTDRSIDALGRGGSPAVRACADCHESPHDRDFVSGVAARTTTLPEASCAVCHAIAHQGFGSGEATVAADLHAASGFPLDAPHDRAACADCHAPERDGFAARHPGRGADDCASCHADPHGGQFDTGPFARAGLGAADCAACHQRTTFEPHAFDVDDHARTGMPLVGLHTVTACEDCHARPDAAAPRRFADTPSTCVGCHGDAHDRHFDRFAGDLDGGGRGLCAACHDPHGFRAAARDFDHARFAAFPIDGAHAQAECTVCHPRAELADAHGRTFGRVAAHFGDYQGCVTCHADPHDGQFDRGDLPTHVGERVGCARCHATTSFRAVAFADDPEVPQGEGFDHATWTGFALTGAHQRLDCAACHPPLAAPDPHTGRTTARAEGADCASCHVDPHAGQFDDRDGRTDCARCHTAVRSFAELRFRHDLDSRFRLGEAHKGVACTACHRPERIGDAEVTRYRPLPRDCNACHGTRDDPLRGRGRDRR